MDFFFIASSHPYFFPLPSLSLSVCLFSLPRFFFALCPLWNLPLLFLIACKRPLGITQNATQAVSSSPHEAVLMVHLGEKEKSRDREEKQRVCGSQAHNCHSSLGPLLSYSLKRPRSAVENFYGISAFVNSERDPERKF